MPFAFRFCTWALSLTRILALVANIQRTFLSSKSVSIHHAPKFGLICGLVGFDSEIAKLHTFVTMRDVFFFFFERKRDVF